MHDTQTLVPAQELASTNKAHYPNESAEYRAARNNLLVEEIELRRHLERIASQRRALPPGGEVPQDFKLACETGVHPEITSEVNLLGYTVSGVVKSRTEFLGGLKLQSRLRE